MPISYYYPEGPLGPICDFITDDDADRDARLRRRRDTIGDGKEATYGPVDYGDIENTIGDRVPALITRRCRIRTLSDGTQEYYDCENELLSPFGTPPGYPLIEPQYDWSGQSTSPWGLDDNFNPITIGPYDCSPFDPDINIIPLRMYRPDGTFVEKVLTERSSPPTFPVRSGVQTIAFGSTFASFVMVNNILKLRVTGDGAGIVGLKFRWNDNPNTAGTALSSLVVDGVTFNQTGRSGETDAVLTVTQGVDYPITINPGTGLGGKDVQSQTVGFYDLDGQDYNAELIITRTEAEPQTTNTTGYWSEEGNKYAVWVNPEQCTLPTLEQEVTYMIDIPVTDTYTITGGADDSFNVFLNNETVPVIGGVGGIFAGGTNATPFSTTRTLQAGQLKMVVKCVNSDASFVDADGNPTGLAYSWDRNPGGWYVKICRGTSCIEPSTVVWVPSGPHNSWGDFMDTYAVYPSNNLVLKGTPQTTSYNINIPFPGNYTLEYSVDDIGIISLDGTQLVSFSANFPTSNTYTINNLTAGPHVIEVTVTNQAASADSDDWTRNPAGIAWTLTPETSASNVAVKFLSNGDLLATGEGFASVPLTFTAPAATGARAYWTITGDSIDSGYQIASPTKIMFDDDISGGFDENASLTIVSINQVGGSNIGVTFSSDGSGIDITGAGSADVVFHFAWNDNPNIAGRAVNNLELLGTTFIQSSQTGNQTETIRVSGSTTQVSYYIGGQSFVQTANAVTTTKTISVNGGGQQGRLYTSSSFYTQNLRTENNGQRLCLNDNGTSNNYMAYSRGVQINRTGGYTEYNVDLGYEDTTDTSLYFYPIVRAIAEEYTSGRFGRIDNFPNRGRAPDRGGMDSWVTFYLNDGGSLGGPVDPVLFDKLRFAIFTAYANNPLGNEADLGDIISVVYPPRCTVKIEIGTPNQGVSNEPIIASSLDLAPFIEGGNLVWSTRDATGFSYKQIGSTGSSGGSGSGY